MISQETIEKIADLARKQADETKVPSPFLVEHTNEVAQRLAKDLNAKKEIIALSTNLMDYMAGVALSEGRKEEHVKMGEEEAKKILNEFSEITGEEKEEIMWCIREHHGTEKFHSIESEICCNADCYKFISVKGFFGGVSAGKARSYDEIVKLYKFKVEEKWNALSLEQCKKELTTEYDAIKQFLDFL